MTRCKELCSIAAVFRTSYVIKMPAGNLEMDGGRATRTVVAKPKVGLNSIPAASRVVEPSEAVD